MSYEFCVTCKKTKFFVQLFAAPLRRQPFAGPLCLELLPTKSDPRDLAECCWNDAWLSRGISVQDFWRSKTILRGTSRCPPNVWVPTEGLYLSEGMGRLEAVVSARLAGLPSGVQRSAGSAIRHPLTVNDVHHTGNSSQAYGLRPQHQQGPHLPHVQSTVPPPGLLQLWSAGNERLFQQPAKSMENDRQ